MARQITANTQQIKTKADQLHKLNDQFKKQVEQLESYEQTLNAGWDGEANDKFHKAFLKDKTQMHNFYNLVEQYVQALQQIINKYENAEIKNAKIASERKY